MFISFKDRFSWPPGAGFEGLADSGGLSFIDLLLCDLVQRISGVSDSRRGKPKPRYTNESIWALTTNYEL